MREITANYSIGFRQHALSAYPFSNFCQRIQQIQTCKTTLITRYILHEIQPLFDDHKRDIRLEFGFIGYSDCIITVFPHHTDNGMNAGYDEMFVSEVPAYLTNSNNLENAMYVFNLFANLKIAMLTSLLGAIILCLQLMLCSCWM
ncbi:hypothetical protein PHYBLDRAFT_170779 [Phycomyces blakesleeanus NRRL 1555(-)]|uniref:Uncharacterized protein n=1 Tax=Phycomyces blakesleeanus (strain ATCC 8743b / DSM 1359 / FGSC 10004 / NBRC 33097 / NRRL 1555) TaxID=763407 RepID=A0A162WXT0_PHYB8|nr:hypothetical protein PHYBLDRAFT_170779 [Phycomyces blakesleeanus NRRL 1555(-)]OAD71415.1 hypothetical protein PHYBLDRAFT_170779 [Phycomyces blakesleeanus NRRL 1555(-)]|eukprot:XP_018289455.1 hypothetical protein PHYBLDRAFT_170779 [Phycomyces blakesleeanus NRRL 1555(-)]